MITHGPIWGMALLEFSSTMTAVVFMECMVGAWELDTTRFVALTDIWELTHFAVRNCFQRIGPDIRSFWRLALFT
jgi:hypothetical protein